MMTMLKTETNTAEMEDRILGAFRKRRPVCDVQLDFEHGQWWVTALGTGTQWSVVDAEGGASVDGFDFEIVTEGDTDA
jgi:hypothetical protein